MNKRTNSERINAIHTADKRHLLEAIVYIVVWIIVFFVPVVYNLFDYLADNIDDFRWNEVFQVWMNVLPFFLLFLLNNFVLIPRLFMRQKVTLYILTTILVTAALFWSIDATFPDRGKVKRHHVESGIRGNKYVERLNTRYFIFSYLPYENRSTLFNHVSGTFLSRVLLALLMFSFNLAVKQFFRSLEDKSRYEELERTNLKNELRYLKYQINPHFFMNTLNNIHSLIDTDSEKAKQTLIELSRMMRYVLYDSNQRTVPLEKEIQFLMHYIRLMRLRYSADKVDISADFPCEPADTQVPPLIYISFLENAFKHGISYQFPSFVHCSLHIEDRKIIFRCSNSCYKATTDGQPGIGLENIRKRLQLIYKEAYTLDIHNSDRKFTILLNTPTIQTAPTIQTYQQ
ncbi:MAG: histidine kinase [Prevotellaceae bacterium]|jgi:hypothetical protein|nr:histidine kinase [Prevotellaceae bacterium]